MYRRAFPRCAVDGPVDPVPFGHLHAEGAVPRKCRGCDFLFEGECARAGEALLELDHGPCPIPGDTRPTRIDSQFISSKVEIPAKCRGCKHLELTIARGFLCGFEKERWGWFRRSLDWGTWEPDLPNVGLDSGLAVSALVLRAVKEGREAEMIPLFLADHPEVSLSEARGAFSELRRKLDQGSR